MEDQLDEARDVAGNRAPCNLVVLGPAHGVMDALLLQLFFGGTNTRNLRDGVDPVWEKLGEVMALQQKGITHGQAPLFHGGRSETRWADHIPGRIDMRT